jgi:hypothetical protein
MKKTIDSKALGLIASTILLIATIGGYIWMWNSTRSEIDSSSVVTYQTVSIDSIETDAKALVKDKPNQGNLPLAVPTSDKIGRENPFAGI